MNKMSVEKEDEKKQPACRGVRCVMRFMGSKIKFYEHFNEILENIEYESVLDAFSGSGVVSYFFKNLNKNVISNDIQYFSYCVCKSYLDTNDINEEELLEIIGNLNKD